VIPIAEFGFEKPPEFTAGGHAFNGVSSTVGRLCACPSVQVTSLRDRDGDYDDRQSVRLESRERDARDRQERESMRECG
jgi:hypothetical protein